ncbi:MAG: class I SAM-dependent methyltransferase [bacterium]
MTSTTSTDFNSYYDQDRHVMLDFVPSGVGRVLEVGCASGKFGTALKAQRNCEVWGIELHPPAAEIAAQSLDKVLVTDVEAGTLTLPSAYFDCVIYNDILEHLRDPWQHLRDIQSHLRPGGHVVASIPNIRHHQVMNDVYFRGEWRYQSAGILDQTHLRFFTKTSIREMFESVGYKVQRLEGINGAEFPWKFGLINRLLLNALNDMRYMQFACVAQYAGAPDVAQRQGKEVL